MVYTNKEMYYVVQGLGRQVFTMPQPFSAPIELFKAIGMKGYDIVNPGGGCTIIFDNVYVLRNGAPCD